MSDAPSPSRDSLLIEISKYLWYSGIRVPWLIGYNVAGAALLVLVFAVTSQGQDLLRIAAELGFGLERNGLLWNLLLLFGTLIASVLFWYTSRLLLGRPYPGYPLPHPYAEPGRRWWPRLTGVAVPLAVGLTFRWLEPEPPPVAATLSWVYLALAALLLAAYVLRRLLFGIDRDYMIGRLPEDIPPEHRRRGRMLLLGAFVLLVLFMIVPVHLPQWLGAPAIIVLGVAGIALFGSAILTYLPMSKGAPSATLAALLLALLFGLWNQNHPIRVADSKVLPTHTRAMPPHAFGDWRKRPGNAERRPIFVTASGGGIRAAYWTATTLAYLQGRFGDAFNDGLFAISGVSGGSLGAATYVTLRRDQLNAGSDTSLLEPAREILGEDFLSPVVAGLLFPDLAQRFLPVPVPPADRQRFLELAWEAAFDGDAQALFRGPFQALYIGANGEHLPNLLLNTTVVETGQRAIVSSLKVDHLPDVLDLLQSRYQLQAIRTSAAAGASARFTYVSPAGRIDLEDGNNLRLVDGGYFENSGAATIGDLLATLADPKQPALRPILIMIRNNPTAPPLRGPDSGIEPPGIDGFNAAISEVAAPAEALLATREARERVAEVKAARLVEEMQGSVIEVPLGAVLKAQQERMKTALESLPEQKKRERLTQLQQPYLEPPLGWSLSKQVREAMDDTLECERGGLDGQFRKLAEALGVSAGEPPACEPL